MDKLIPFLVGLVSLCVGYLLRGLTENRSRKPSLVRDRLDTIHQAIAHLARMRAEIGAVHAQGLAAAPDEQVLQSTKRIGELNVAGTGIVQDGESAADALGASDLVEAFKQAVTLLAGAIATPKTSTASLASKLAEIRKMYEALRDQLA